jgi:hypothetical protein
MGKMVRMDIRRPDSAPGFFAPVILLKISNCTAEKIEVK